MDDVSAGEATRQGAHVRRRRMRADARSLHVVEAPVSDRYQTPEWLERSFVLPLTEPEANDVPSQSVPHHDDDPELTEESNVIPHVEPDEVADPAAAASFVRPTSNDIDFARVVRRSDLCRAVTRLHWATTGLACAALVFYLLAGSTLVLATVIAFAVVSVVAFAVRIRLSHAPVPRLQR
jgi:hypothetical protein